MRAHTQVPADTVGRDQTRPRPAGRSLWINVQDTDVVLRDSAVRRYADLVRCAISLETAYEDLQRLAPAMAITVQRPA